MCFNYAIKDYTIFKFCGKHFFLANIWLLSFDIIKGYENRKPIKFGKVTSWESMNQVNEMLKKQKKDA